MGPSLDLDVHIHLEDAEASLPLFLGLCHLARSDRDDLFEDPFPRRANLFLPFKNLAHVDIHVIFHFEISLPVPSNLDDRCDG